MGNAKRTREKSEQPEVTISDGVNILLAVALQLEKLGLVSWKTLEIDGTKGFALFFPVQHWALKGEKLILKKVNQ